MPVNDNTTPAVEAKTFSQEDVNRIVQERLAKEKTKSESHLAEKAAELTKRELMLSAREEFAKKDIPVELLDIINLSDADALDKAVGLLTTFIKTQAPLSAESAIRVNSGREHGRDTNAGDDIRSAMGLS